MRMLCLLLLGTLLLACEKSIPQPDLSPAPEPGVALASTPPTALGADLLQQVNAVRASGCRCGNQWMPAVPILYWNALLAAAATQHATDMAGRHFFAHQGTDGSSVGERVTAAGFLWQQVGENIAWGQTSVTSVLGGWLASDGHCRNIMAPNFTHMAVARQGDYWVQVLARPR